MRSHTVAAEGGAAGVIKHDDSLDYHFHDTVSRRRLASDQDAVELFVNEAPHELHAAGALGLSVEPRAGRQGRGAAVRRHEDRAHLVRRRQDRLPHAAHAVPDVAEVSRRSSASTNTTPPICWSTTAVATASSRSRCASGRMVAFHAKAVIIAPAAPGGFSRSPPTARSRPATAWPWPTAPACR